MHISYQGEKGAYSYSASLQVAKRLAIPEENIAGFPDFSSVWKRISDEGIGVLPIENSYAGSIHENLYNFVRYDHKIVGEIHLEINHALLSLETDISVVKRAYSHPQALAQCHDFLVAHGIEPIPSEDTAGSAKMIAERGERGVAAVASEIAGEVYGLHALARGIQDQKGNTTRFFVVVPRSSDIRYSEKATKTSILFETRDIPGALYKCLGAFATNGVNLSKIESLPSLKDPFTYTFWVDFHGTGEDTNVHHALDELRFFTQSVNILGEY